MFQVKIKEDLGYVSASIVSDVIRIVYGVYRRVFGCNSFYRDGDNILPSPMQSGYPPVDVIDYLEVGSVNFRMMCTHAEYDILEYYTDINAPDALASEKLTFSIDAYGDGEISDAEIYNAIDSIYNEKEKQDNQ